MRTVRPESQTLRMERLFDATPEQLWDAYTKPELYAQWISPFPGLPAEIHEMDVRVGGRCRFTMVGPNGTRFPETVFEFEVLDRPREIVHYEANEGRPDVFNGWPMRIRTRFEPVGAQTRLTMELEGMPPQVPAEMAMQGFGACLDKLAEVVKARAPATPTLRLERTFDATPEQAWAAWTDPAQYAKWLNPAPIDLVIHEWDLREGGRVKFDMPQPDGNRNPQEGVFHLLRPCTRLVSGNDDRTFLVDVEFQPRGPTRTHLIVTITGVPPDWHAAATQGWGVCFDKLERLLKGRAS